MPIVTLTVRAPCTAERKSMLLEAVQEALVASGANPRDRFHRVHELAEQDFRFDPTFPDVATQRTAEFALVDVLLGVGRSVKVKRKILQDIVERVSARGFDPENLMVVFQDVAWENWSPAGGRVPHA